MWSCFHSSQLSHIANLLTHTIIHTSTNQDIQSQNFNTSAIVNILKYKIFTYDRQFKEKNRIWNLLGL